MDDLISRQAVSKKIEIPVCMMAQTVLMVYTVAALKGINRKMGRRNKCE